MASPNSVKIVKVCKVAPATTSLESAREVSLPLTFLDITRFRFPPAECLFFYKLTESTPAFFHSAILPRLKNSLSQTLLHFLPLAGHLVWPSESSVPIILYSPNDAVSLTVAESNADLDRFVDDGIREVGESHPYLPQLLISDAKASLIALQITHFPNRGFCIGITIHHAMLDGKSTSIFFQAWAHTCKHYNEETTELLDLPLELTPCFDSTVIKDPIGLGSIYLKQLANTKGLDLASNPRSLKVMQNLARVPPNLYRATFHLPRESINKLREMVMRYQTQKVGPRAMKQLHLSTFVLTCAYVSVCLVKARGEDRDRDVYFVCSVDCRSRLHPPTPPNYLGYCVVLHHMVAKAEDFMEESGIADVAGKIGDLVKGLENGLFQGAEERLVKLRGVPPDVQKIRVAGSTRFGFYRLDFGWGRTAKMEITSIDKTRGFSIMESRDGNGGVEVCVVLLRHEMEAFASLFSNGLRCLHSRL